MPKNKEQEIEFKTPIKRQDLETIMDKIGEMHDVIELLKSKNSASSIKAYELDKLLEELTAKNNKLFKEFQFKFYLNFNDK